MGYIRKIARFTFIAIFFFLMQGCCSWCKLHPNLPWCNSCLQPPIEKVSLTPDISSINVTQKDDTLTIITSMSEIYFKDISTEKGDFVALESEGMINTFGNGTPNLPVFSRLIEVPLEATLEYSVKSSREDEINLEDEGYSNKIIPAQPPQVNSWLAV